MESNFATIWESIADVIGDDAALVQGTRRVSWRDFDDRAARLAGVLAAAGLEPGSKVAELLYNSPEYMETYFACLKQSYVPVNVNYRYVEDELVYLLDNSDAEALVFHSSLGERVAAIRDRLPGVKVWIEVDDGGVGAHGAEEYEAVLARSEPAGRRTRSGDDITMLYTGGTTGMPKGVMSKVGGTVDTILVTTPPVFGLEPIAAPADVADFVVAAKADGFRGETLPACPLMHGTGMGLGALPALTLGGCLVFLEGRGLDVDELWTTVEREGVVSMIIVGDAFARPLLKALRDGSYDTSTMRIMVSSGAMWSEEVRAGLIEQIPQLVILDFIAASEGAMGIAFSMAGAIAPTGRFNPNPGVVLISEDDQILTAGSDESGMIGIGGDIPDGYYKDQAKTDKTFRTIGDMRYSIPGDWATIGADGSLTLLGRGSQCINTGGEKVYPEEVEEAIKTHPAVDDCLVFGVPDERFGQRVVGVASTNATADPDAIVDGARASLSAYKLPRTLLLVDEVPRAPNGKADYPAAKALFEAAAT